MIFPRRPTRRGAAIHYGADYNPDQWPEEVWAEDMRLMKEAGVTVVTLPVFSWARIQPDEHTWDLDWLDRVMDLLAGAGIDVDMATSTASPPPWLTTAHPEVLPVTFEGHTLWPGGRQQWRPTSPVFRRHALEVTRRLAGRYHDHPALVAWHVNNELGCHNAYDYSDDAAAAFRVWLTERYGDLPTLNEAWGTAFWAQRYSDWDQVLPPRLAASENNPSQLLDFRRFSSDALRDHLRAENEVLRELSPGVPITTNFMVMGETHAMDYASWTGDVDFVSNDHYLQPGAGGIDELAFSASYTSALADGEPWWLMEHSPSAVNWRGVNPAKAPGQIARDALTHLGHGADAICYFQWRASTVGSEKYHAAMLPHAGAGSRVFRDVCALGASLRGLAEVAGAQSVPAQVAVVLDYESWWSLDQAFLPHSGLDYRGRALAWYRALVDAGVRVDVVTSGSDLSRYRVVVAALLHVVPAGLAERLEAAVRGGTHLVTTAFSGTVDERDHVVPGGYPGALRHLLGVRVEEFRPLPAGEELVLDDGSLVRDWAEAVQVADGPGVDDAQGPDGREPAAHQEQGTEVLRRYAGTGATGTAQAVADGLDALVGEAAVTRRHVGEGAAVYVGALLDDDGLRALAVEVLDGAGVEPELPEALAGEVIASLRRGEEAEYWTLTNRGRREFGSQQVAELLRSEMLQGGDVLAGALGTNDALVLRLPRSRSDR